MIMSIDTTPKLIFKKATFQNQTIQSQTQQKGAFQMRTFLKEALSGATSFFVLTFLVSIDVCRGSVGDDLNVADDSKTRQIIYKSNGIFIINPSSLSDKNTHATNFLTTNLSENSSAASLSKIDSTTYSLKKSPSNAQEFRGKAEKLKPYLNDLCGSIVASSDDQAVTNINAKFNHPNQANEYIRKAISRFSTSDYDESSFYSEEYLLDNISEDPQENLSIDSQTSQAPFTLDRVASIKRYADEFLNAESISLSAINGAFLTKSIEQNRFTDEDERVATAIATEILNISGGMFLRLHQLPDELKPYFKEVSKNHVEYVLSTYTLWDTLPGAVEYFYNMGTRYVDRGAKDQQIVDLIAKVIPDDIHLYITIDGAINRHKQGKEIPHRIVVNADKMHLLNNNIELIRHKELVINIENKDIDGLKPRKSVNISGSVARPLYHAQSKELYLHGLRDYIKGIRIVGKNITSLNLFDTDIDDQKSKLTILASEKLRGKILHGRWIITYFTEEGVIRNNGTRDFNTAPQRGVLGPNEIKAQEFTNIKSGLMFLGPLFRCLFEGVINFLIRCSFSYI